MLTEKIADSSPERRKDKARQMQSAATLMRVPLLPHPASGTTRSSSSIRLLLDLRIVTAKGSRATLSPGEGMRPRLVARRPPIVSIPAVSRSTPGHLPQLVEPCAPAHQEAPAAERLDLHLLAGGDVADEVFDHIAAGDDPLEATELVEHDNDAAIAAEVALE